VFVVLQNYHDRELLLRNQPSSLAHLFNRYVRKHEGFEFRACQTEPEAIVWENIGISMANYLFRGFIVFCLLCVCTCVGVIIIFMLEVLETASIGDAYYFHEKSMGDVSAVSEDSLGCEVGIGCGTMAEESVTLTFLI
jgi:hypothetical protein